MDCNKHFIHGLHGRIAQGIVVLHLAPPSVGMALEGRVCPCTGENTGELGLSIHGPGLSADLEFLDGDGTYGELLTKWIAM